MIGFLREFWAYARARKRVWLVPMLTVFVMLVIALFWGGALNNLLWSQLT